MMNNKKLRWLAKELGYDSAAAMLEECVGDSVMPGACTVDGCLQVHEELEPDCTDAWCSQCRTHTVQSVAVLAGVV